MYEIPVHSEAYKLFESDHAIKHADLDINNFIVLSIKLNNI